MVVGLGLLFGNGAAAYLSRLLGRGDKDTADKTASTAVYGSVLTGAVFICCALIFLKPVLGRLGALESVMPYALSYGRIYVACSIFNVFNVAMNNIVSSEGAAKMAMWALVAGAGLNLVLDPVFIYGLNFGVSGAALATGISQAVGALVPIFYFARKNDSILRLGSTGFYGAVLLKACGNGSSELLSNICSSMVSMLYNFQLMRLAGEDGVAAYGVIMYVSFIFAAISIGYAVGSAPVVGFHYGAENSGELKSLLGKSVRLTAGAGIAMAVLAAVLSAPLSKIFVSYDQELLEMTVRGFRVYAFSFLFVSFNIFASSFFTALGNGGVSALISALRTLVFQCVGVLILPILLELDGVWLAVVAAEAAACAVSVLALVLNRKVYRY